MFGGIMNNDPLRPAALKPANPGVVILACSGCSSAGELADLTARRMQQLGTGKMSCLAGVGGRVSAILTAVSRAPRLLMIDGCPLECGANVLRLAGISKFQHLKLHEQAIRKHGQPVEVATVERLAAAAAHLLEDVGPTQPPGQPVPIA
jgi:uncharacterized metal-binding protein